MPGARVLLEAVAGRIPIAVATHSPRAMLVITIPSQPGKDLPGDFVVASLEDPEIVAWAQNVKTS